MRYFTDNPAERMMMEIPRPCSVADKCPVLEQSHPCYGCRHYGEVCVLPCYRGVASVPAVDGSAS